MNFSEIYGEVDIGVKATTPDDYTHLPVDSYVDRHELEAIQEQFWTAYIEVAA